MATKFTYNNSNSVEDGGAFFTVPGMITVGADAFIYNFTSNLGPNNYNPALTLFNGAYTVTVNGIVGSADTSSTGHGIEFNSSVGTSKLTVGASGYIFGGWSGIAAFHPTTIVNAGEIDGLVNGIDEQGDGNWTITNNKDGLIQSVGTGILIDGAGLHTITNAGYIYSDSGNAITATGGGNEKFTNSGLLYGFVDLGDGNDVVTNTGDVGGGLTFGDGNNTFINKGDVGSTFFAVTFGNGNNVLTNSGELYGDIDFGDGNDKFTNSGTMDGFSLFGSIMLDFGEGNNVFTNSGMLGSNEVSFDVTFGSGNDKFTNTGTSYIDSLSLGGGNDIYTGGAADDFILDEAGDDNYKLGAGDDVFSAVGLDSGGDIDTVDGGAGLYDYFDASGAISDLVINLDSKGQFDPYFSITATAKTATDDGAGEIGLNKISNFEGVYAGDGDDTVFGSAGSNDLSGGGGDDDLFGLAGNDSLYGDDGEDYLIGGAGRDQLTGGIDEDRFIYTALSDSTAAIKGRDVILDFEDGIDQIDLSAIVLKDGSAHFVGTNARFGDGQVGDVRAMITGTGWTIQMDAQKDGVPDFAIDVYDLNHAIVWSSADFVADLV